MAWEISEMNRRLKAFKNHRRGFIAFIIFMSLFTLSLFAEFIASDQPLYVKYNGKSYFPVFKTYYDKEFGGDFETPADYHDLLIQKNITENGKMIFPLIPFGPGTIDYKQTSPAPGAPSKRHWLGTDDLGRDVLARVIYGTRLSIIFGLTLTFFSSLIGIFFGALQGYMGGKTDLFMQRFLEIWGGLPQLFILIMVSSLFTPSFFTLLLILLLFSWTTLIPLVRAEFLKVRKYAFVRAAKVLGVPTLSIMFRHILPNAMVAVFSYLPFILTGAITALATLDFLGFGLPMNTPSLGELVRQGKENIHAPHLGLTAFFVLATLLVLLIFIGEGVRTAFAPVANKKSKIMIKAETAKEAKELLSVSDLKIKFSKSFYAVSGISFSINKGKVLALIGESGSGKSVTALSVLRLLRAEISGNIQYAGKNILAMKEKTVQKIRGKKIAMIFQDPLDSFDPLKKVGYQLIEAVQIHAKVSKKRAEIRAKSMMKKVELGHLINKFYDYPHQFSGGERQRLMIAMALINNPDILIADEPTTALDALTQDQIIHLLKKLKEDMNLSILFITHNLALAESFADDIAVMKGGKIVETGTKDDILENPRHPYTQRLLKAANIRPRKHEYDKMDPLLVVENLSVSYKENKAVKEVSLKVNKGETVGIMGASGSGKTSLANAILHLEAKTGLSTYKGKDERREVQAVFQDPYASLDPRMTIEEIVGEGLKIYEKLSKEKRREKIKAVLRQVGLSDNILNRYPDEFSGGQRQRIAIARALIVKPKLIVLDEPTSALDVSVQAGILKLLRQLQEEENLSYLFISHDKRVMRMVADRIIVMQNGMVVEEGRTEALFRNPKHSYTKLLLSVV